MIIAIAIYKLANGTAFVLLALAVHHLMLQGDVAQTVENWVREIKLDPHNHVIHSMLGKLTGVSERQLRELSIGTLIYASLFYIEGVGLLFRRRWAEWMVVITTGIFLPLEAYEVYHRTTVVRIAILAANLAIVVYLIVRLYRTRPVREQPVAAAGE
jgi:uncharacterized membrane protein (DUF2068 family)